MSRYEVRFGERVVELVELDAGQMSLVMRAGNVPGNAQGTGYNTALEGLRHSIASIDGKVVKYNDLAGKGLSGYFRSKEIVLLQTAWNKMHLPDEEELVDVGNGMTPISGV